WIVGRVHDDPAEKSLSYREPSATIGVWMIPVCASRSRTHAEGVVVCLARRDWLEWTAIGLNRQMDPVPVNGRRFREIVPEVNDDVIPFAYIQCWTRDVSVVSKYFALDTRLQRQRRHSSGEVHFDCLGKFRDVDEEGRICCVTIARNDRARSEWGCAERLVRTGERDERSRQSQQSEDRKSVGHASPLGL